MASFKRAASFVIAGLTCPCHLPIYLALLGGTALGGVIRENTGLVVLGLTGAFLASLLYAVAAGKRRSEQRGAAEAAAHHDPSPAQSHMDRAVSDTLRNP